MWLGREEHLHTLGREVLSVSPIPPIAMNVRTGVAVLSYGDELFFGVLADYETVPDVDGLARGIEQAVARLKVSSRRRRSPSDRHGLSVVVDTA